MAGSKSDYLEAKLLDHVLGNTPYSAPANVYIALYTTAPTDAGGGVEVVGGNYARVALVNNITNWPNASGTPTSKSNGTIITFPIATASWGTIAAFGVFDASTSGNLLYWATLTAPTLVDVGFVATFSNGTLIVVED